MIRGQSWFQIIANGWGELPSPEKRGLIGYSVSAIDTEGEPCAWGRGALSLASEGGTPSQSKYSEVPYIRTLKSRTFEDANVHSHVKSRKSVHVYSVHCHMRASSTSGCAFVYCTVQLCIECMCAKLLQLCPTLWDPVEFSFPASSVHEILQARILEWVVMPSSRGSSLPRDWTDVLYVSCTGRRVLYH